MISTLNGRQFTRLVARRYNAIASLPLRGKRQLAEPRGREKSAGEKKRGGSRAREKARRDEGIERDSGEEVGRPEGASRARCVFVFLIFPGRFVCRYLA